MSHQDYQFEFMSEARIELVARAWNKLATDQLGNAFNIMHFVERILTPLYTKKGNLQIEFFDQEFKHDDPAYVTFKPSLVLHVDRDVWKKASEGDAYCRHIIAHEVGHILLHDQTARAYSTDPVLRTRIAAKQQSAEWQANTFAAYFLVSDNLVERVPDAAVVAIVSNVPYEIAVERVSEFKRARPAAKLGFLGDPCSKCGDFAVFPNEAGMQCNQCGNKASSVPEAVA